MPLLLTIARHLVESQEGSFKMHDSIITLTANLAAVYRTETVDGKEWRIMSGVLMVEGVHTANNGPLYYPAPELEKSAPDWESIPLLLDHPNKDGKLVAADSDPSIYETSGLGEVRKVTWNGKLATEYWFDMERCDKVDPRIRKNMDDKKPMEVSTGLAHEIDKKESTFNGTGYTGIVRGIVPDHVALLLDKEGACNLKKGCGCGITSNAAQERLPLTANEASFSRISMQLQDFLYKTNDYGYIRDIYSDFFVYTGRNGQLWQQSYSMDGDTVVVADSDPIKVKWVTEYRTEAGNHFVGNCSAPKEIDVDKKTQIAALISGGTFTEADRAWLEGQPDTKIVALHGKLTANAAPAVTPPNPAPVPAPVPAVRQMSYNEWVATLPPEKQEEEIESRRASEQMKADLIATITANTKDSPAGSLSPDYLGKQPMAVLKVLATTTAPKEVAVPTPNYGGLAVIPPTHTANTAAPHVAYKPPQLFKTA